MWNHLCLKLFFRPWTISSPELIQFGDIRVHIYKLPPGKIQKPLSDMFPYGLPHYFFLMASKTTYVWFCIVAGVQGGTTSCTVQYLQQEAFVQHDDTATVTFFYLYPSHPHGKIGSDVFSFHFWRKEKCNLFPTLFQLSAVCKISGPVFCALKASVSLSIQREKVFEGKIACGTLIDMQHFVFHISLNGKVWRNIYILYEQKVLQSKTLVLHRLRTAFFNT